MSYLKGPRIVFAGDFQADVSTVNNDVRHYDTASFEERFQQPRTSEEENGWWNPIGSGAYRLVNCRVQGVTRADGTWINNPTDDGAVGLYVANALDAPAGKLVDLDPQWQMASMIWGLTLRLTNGTNRGHLVGCFEPAPLRDLSQRQFIGDLSNRQPLTSYFQSVMTELAWDLDTGIDSPVLKQLHAAARDGLLSVLMNTFGYYSNSSAARFTLGRLIGVIGVATTSEPRGFVLGRRFAPAKSNEGDPDTTPEGVNYFTAVVDEEQGTLTADLGNALPILDPMGTTLQELGELVLGVLTTPDGFDPQGNPSFVTQGAVLEASGYVTIGTLPYLEPGWLTKTAGILTFRLDEKASALVGNHPLALLQPLRKPGQVRVMLRETVHGYYVRADAFEHRLNPGAQPPGKEAPTDSVEVSLYASQYGKPLGNAPLRTVLAPPMKDQGGGRREAHPPKAPIPLIGTPPEAVSLSASVRTEPSGRAMLRITAQSPRTPRGYIDGQIYIINYNLCEVHDWELYQQHSLDGIYLHVRDAFTPPAHPTWEDDIRPILEQYGNLYPVMSRRLVNLGDYSAMAEHRDILELAFSRDIEDPNYMPATRDLSPAKLAMILHWLRERTPEGRYLLRRGPRMDTMPVATMVTAQTLPPETPTAPPLSADATQRVQNYQRLGFIKGYGTES